MITSYITIQDKAGQGVIQEVEEQILEEVEGSDLAPTLLSSDCDDLTLQVDHEDPDSVKDAAACIVHILLEAGITSIELTVKRTLGEDD